MSNPEHLAKLKEGPVIWNQWREEHPEILPDLSKADLRRIDLTQVNLSKANLRQTDLTNAELSNASLEYADFGGATLIGANLRESSLLLAEMVGANLRMALLRGAKLAGANLRYSIFYQAELREARLPGADLTEANLREVMAGGASFRRAIFRKAQLEKAKLNETDLRETDFRDAVLRQAFLYDANLFGADLTRADLRKADLSKAYVSEAKLCEADLSDGDLESARLIKTNMEKAVLTGCRVYGISAWDLNLDGATQSNLIITSSYPPSQPIIQVDNIEVAQFIYLLLNNQKIRQVIDTITSKLVLILGRFTPERKSVLEAIRNELRKLDYLPVLFDFESPSQRDITETVSTLAHMARFVIADITDAKSIPQELERIVPDLPSVPVQPLLLASQREYSMFEHLRRYPWVLETVLYKDQQDLLKTLKENVIRPAEAKARKRE